MIYPIIKLDGGASWAPHHDIGGYLRWLERSVARVLEAKGLETEARADATGVWCRRSGSIGGRAQEFKKIASIGVAVRRWVTYHGVAINVTNALEPFSLISPCGFSPEVMTSLQAQLPESTVTVDEFWKLFQSGI